MMQDAIKKSEVLIEALPYIKKFFRKNIVIKFGGSAIGDKAIRKTVLEDIVFMNFAGMRPVLIHGGGPYISEKMKEKGKKPKFVDGLRVTDKETMEIVDEALTDLNNKLVKEIKDIGADAFGLSCKENKLITAERLYKNKEIDFTGKAKSVDATVLNQFLEDNVIPVISPVAMGHDGNLYNVNADEAASNIAIAIKAEKIIVLTNVEGILREENGEKKLFHSLSLDDAKFLIEKKVVSNGMIPKTKACLDALEGKVKKAHIVNSSLSHALLLEIFTDKGIGTEIVKLGRRTKATENI